VGVGGQAGAVDVLAEAVELLLAQPPEQEGAGVDAGRRVALDEDEIAAVLFGRPAPEMDEADVVERRRRGEAGDVAAEVGAALVGAQHHRQRVPAHVGADAVLDRVIARRGDLAVGRDGVDVFGVGAVGLVDAGKAAQLDQALDDVVGALGAFLLDDGLEGVEPLARFLGIGVAGAGDDGSGGRHG